MTIDGYTDRALAAARRARDDMRGAVDRWIDAPDGGPTAEEARRLRAQGWTPTKCVEPSVRQLCRGDDVLPVPDRREAA